MKQVKTHNSIKYISVTAILAALTFVATYAIQVPTIAGYIHIGDSMVFLAAALLPTPYAMLASAVGASLADLCAGYVAYIPVTALVRILVALCFSRKGKMLSKRNIVALGLAFLIYGIGYFAFDWVYYATFATAIAALPLNLLQVAVSAVLFVLIAKTCGNLLKRYIPSPKEKISENTDSR